MKDVIEALIARRGTFVGEGVNHDGQPFTGRLKLAPVVDGAGLSLEFTARGEGGEVYHRERSTLAPGPDGALTLWSLSNNAPGLLALPLRRDVPGEARALVFGVGDPDDGDAFRMEVTLELQPGGQLGYRFAWGLPGGEFAPRSGLTLRAARHTRVPEAKLVPAGRGERPGGPGWYVLNLADARWKGNGANGAYTAWEEGCPFEDYGVNVHVLEPGQPSCKYHRESAQEDFLVLAGECLLLVEGEERPLKAGDFVHCPAWTGHVFVGAGDAPCAVLMIGARDPAWAVDYPVDALAQRHGAGVDAATDSPPEAYAETPPFEDVAAPWPLG